MHFYNRDGEPKHTMPTKAGAKNPTRPTDLRDARRLGLLPSVTTIMETTLANAGLDHWKRQQLLKAAFECTRIYDETYETWSRHVAEKADAGRNEAAELGTKVHAELENGLKTLGNGITSENPMVIPVLNYVRGLSVESLESEQTVVNHAYNYAGTVDVSGFILNPEDYECSFTAPMIMDFKTKRTSEGNEIDPPETYAWQLAAYHLAKFGLNGHRELHPLATACNVFISTTEPGRIEVMWYDRQQLKEALDCFLATNKLFQLRNKLHHKPADLSHCTE